MRAHVKNIIGVIVIAIVSILPAPTATAQSDVMLSQYYEVPTLYNPASVGRTEYLNIHGAGRLQWIGIDGAPKTFLGAVDMPFKLFGQRFGGGVVAQQEGIGLYSSLNLNAQLAYKLRKLKGEFTFAVQVGMFDQRFKGSEVYIPDGDDYHQSADDGIPTTDLHGTALDLGAGVWYERNKWYVGVSMTHITSPSIGMGGENGGTGADEALYEFNVDRTLYFMTGCNIPIKNTLFEVIPSMLFATDFKFYGGEITARARYNKFLSFGVGYRWDDAVVATIAAEVKNFYIGYSFDYPTSSLRSASAGSHEIVVGYSLKLNMGDKNNHRHRSIRIM